MQIRLENVTLYLSWGVFWHPRHLHPRPCVRPYPTEVKYGSCININKHFMMTVHDCPSYILTADVRRSLDVLKYIYVQWLESTYLEIQHGGRRQIFNVQLAMTTAAECSVSLNVGTRVVPRDSHKCSRLRGKRSRSQHDIMFKNVINRQLIGWPTSNVVKNPSEERTMWHMFNVIR